VYYGWGNNGDPTKGNNQRNAQFQFYSNSITGLAFVNITFINAYTANFQERFFYSPGVPTYSMILNSRFDMGYTNDGSVISRAQTFVKNSIFTQAGWFPAPTGAFFGLGGYHIILNSNELKYLHFFKCRYSWGNFFALNSNFSYYWGQFSVDTANNVVIRNCSIVRDLRDQVS